jgi:hypothetical protein
MTAINLNIVFLPCTLLRRKPGSCFPKAFWAPTFVGVTVSYSFARAKKNTVIFDEEMR